ncbi:hypothetical protein ABZY57_11635 [Streptomyces sp. NPDC006450]|uniref:hypothetical protein n=1 Tax=Streptomyces sp. NPDC006450 TaxID=3155458 RepID=UPI0033B3C4A5
MYLWEQRRYTLRSAEQCKQLTAARADLDWIGDLPAQAGQQIVRALDRAYDNVWNLAIRPGSPRGRSVATVCRSPSPGRPNSTLNAAVVSGERVAAEISCQI